VSPASASLPSASSAARWFVPGYLDGFFGLFFSGFPDLLLIAGLAPLCGFPIELVASRILPTVALSILGGNLFLRLASASPGAANRPYRRDRDSLWREYADHFRLRVPCVLPERHCANGGSLLHRLAAAAHSAGGAVVSLGRNRDCLPVPGLYFENFSDARAGPCSDGDHSCRVWIKNSPALPDPRWFALHHGRRDSGCSSAGLPPLPPACASRAGTAGDPSAPPRQYFRVPSPRGGLGIPFHHSAHERARHNRFPPDSGERQSGGGRLRDASVTPSQRRGDIGRSGIWQSVSHHALFWTPGPQGIRCARWIFLFSMEW
jgi:hypothetical protein